MPPILRHPALRSNVRVAGIDPALRRIGVASVKAGRIHGELVQTIEEAGARLAEIYAAVFEFITERNVSLVAIEGYSYYSETKLAKLGEAGGVIRLACVDANIPYFEAPPESLKLFVAGNGSASKKTMMSSVSIQYGFETEDDNIADAVGLAMMAAVKLTGESKRRCELQALKNISAEERKRRADAKRERRCRFALCSTERIL